MDTKSANYIRNLASPPGVPAGPVMQKNTILPDPGLCSICGGSGWKPVSGSSEKGGRVTRCECFFEGQGNRLLERAGIPLRYKSCDFSTYVANANDSLAVARMTVQKWADQYPLEKTGLLLVGPSGVGKTHLSVAALKALIKKGTHCLFCDYRELLKQIQNSYNQSAQTTELDLLRPVFEAEVLLLDDLGAVRPSEWVWDTVSLILNTRYNDNRTTIITANFVNEAAHSSETNTTKRAGREETLGDRIGERMRSRLHEMCRVVEVNGKDFRQKIKSTSFR